MTKFGEGAGAPARLFMLGGSAHEQIDVHQCGLKPTTHAIALVQQNPDVWMLQSLAATGERAQHALTLIRCCPWCGVALTKTPPPPTRVTCTCTHLDLQHALTDVLLGTRGCCIECVCEQFSKRGGTQ